MWGQGYYSTKEETREKTAGDEKDGFEIDCIEENGKCPAYARKLVTKIVTEEGVQIL